MNPENTYDLFTAFMHLGAGLSVGLPGLAAGYAIGIAGDAVREQESSCFPLVLTAVGCPRIYAAVAYFRGDGSDSDLRRGAWSLRVGGLLRNACQCLVHTNNIFSLIVGLILNTRAKG